jgi:predicted regulator of Ras-like GTPase activity (Roadblock/LC7/MglB family)
MELEKEVLAEIRALREQLRHTMGVVVAGVDGLLIAHDSHDIDPESLAAMAAAHLGLSQRLADVVGHGELQETVTRGQDGYVATFAAGTSAVLMVIATADLNVGRLYLAARPLASRVGALVHGDTEPSPTDPTSPPPELRRTP